MFRSLPSKRTRDGVGRLVCGDGEAGMGRENSVGLKGAFHSARGRGVGKRGLSAFWTLEVPLSGKGSSQINPFGVGGEGVVGRSSFASRGIPEGVVRPS